MWTPGARHSRALRNTCRKPSGRQWAGRIDSQRETSGVQGSGTANRAADRAGLSREARLSTHTDTLTPYVLRGDTHLRTQSGRIRAARGEGGEGGKGRRALGVTAGLAQTDDRVLGTKAENKFDSSPKVQEKKKSANT